MCDALCENRDEAFSDGSTGLRCFEDGRDTSTLSSDSVLPARSRYFRLLPMPTLAEASGKACGRLLATSLGVYWEYKPKLLDRALDGTLAFTSVAAACLLRCDMSAFVPCEYNGLANDNGFGDDSGDVVTQAS